MKTDTDILTTALRSDPRVGLGNAGLQEQAAIGKLDLPLIPEDVSYERKRGLTSMDVLNK